MGRRDFIADLVALPTADLPSEVNGVRSGDDDGTFIFEVRLPEQNDAVPVAVSLQAMITDPSEYPKSHSYFVYSLSDQTPTSVDAVLNNSNCLYPGLRLQPMLVQLINALRAGSSSPSAEESDQEDLELQDQEELDTDSDMDCTFGDPDISFASQTATAQPSILKDTDRLDPDSISHIKADLRKVKHAGFRVSSAGEIFYRKRSCYVIISIRVAKLGIQEDTLRAWSLDPSMYISLILQYPHGYCTLKHLKGRFPGVNLAVRLSSRYRLSLQEAISIFLPSEEGPSSTKDLFIGEPLNELLNGRLLDIIRYRLLHKLSWQGAEDYFIENQGRLHDPEEKAPTPESDEARVIASAQFPSLVTDDHLSLDTKEHSFPLIAMQFTLRHLVHCTEFCLVCHARLSATFEALKPYVCSKPLCLYQYMALGFGPSIEHEICTQPDVVDLLVSFCYASVVASKLKDRPVGLEMVVSQSNAGTGFDTAIPRKGFAEPKTAQVGSRHKSTSSRFLLDEVRSELKYNDKGPFMHKPTVGQWVHIQGFKVRSQHRCITHVFKDVLSIGPPLMDSIAPNRILDENPTTVDSWRPKPVSSTDDASVSKMEEVDVSVWSTDFDSLQELEQCRAIVNLLKLLPSVADMKAFLESSGSSQRQLKNWKEKMPPACVSLIRWIISSNRSCIVQVESTNPDLPPSEPSVKGMGKQYLQFRFAQGAPDKEQRFTNAVQDISMERKYKYPTIFAWHGSALHNWHGIIREGLNYSRIDNGRAYGDGVYHSLQADTSLSYSRYMSNSTWPQSRLNIRAAICLNEIINAPDEFKSKNPHLVVQHTDWIQTRYLFVNCTTPQQAQRKKLTRSLPQDPQWKLCGPLQVTAKAGNSLTEIVIPLSAIPRSRQGSYIESAKPHKSKKAKVSKDNGKHGKGDVVMQDISEDGHYVSEESSDEDRELTGLNMKGSRNASDGSSAATGKMPFIPGKLSATSLPILPPPEYACSQATKALQRELASTLATQAQEPLHELGWWIDGEMVTNLYQWIVELHSFEKSMPLTADMEAIGVQSIVLEVRFGPSYPYSPPFIRVIRPRFLSHLAGGGGHVTAGGAMCMELLTNNGWNPASSIEAVLLQVRMAISSEEPPARLHRGTNPDYGNQEAVSAYIRACAAHGWTAHDDLAKLSAGRR